MTKLVRALGAGCVAPEYDNARLQPGAVQEQKYQGTGTHCANLWRKRKATLQVLSAHLWLPPHDTATPHGDSLSRGPVENCGPRRRKPDALLPVVLHNRAGEATRTPLDADVWHHLVGLEATEYDR
jgi:hypothetical protein